MSADGALNYAKHTLPCVKFLNAWQRTDSWAQEREGHALSTKHLGHTLLGITRFLMHSGKANNSVNRK